MGVSRTHTRRYASLPAFVQLEALFPDAIASTQIMELASGVEILSESSESILIGIAEVTAILKRAIDLIAEDYALEEIFQRTKVQLMTAFTGAAPQDLSAKGEKLQAFCQLMFEIRVAVLKARKCDDESRNEILFSEAHATAHNRLGKRGGDFYESMDSILRRFLNDELVDRPYGIPVIKYAASFDPVQELVMQRFYAPPSAPEEPRPTPVPDAEDAKTKLGRRIGTIAEIMLALDEDVKTRQDLISKLNTVIEKSVCGSVVYFGDIELIDRSMRTEKNKKV